MSFRFMPLTRRRRPAVQVRRRLALETVEARLAPAVVSGVVFVDSNGDGVRQSTEGGQGGVFVFIDANGDGKYTPAPNSTTPGELFTYSNSTGGYVFTFSKDGNYSVLEVVPQGFTQTAPT